jgi:N-acetylglucosaminyl-diphospho-decaprenol L-rhamnosyltransferase
MAGAAPRVTVVVMTRDRRDGLLAALAELTSRSPGAPVIVVDNGSSDGTPVAVAERFPGVRVIALAENRGATARNAGVAAADTPYVAFSDDDSWWAAGALDRAADLLDAVPRLGLITARVLVGPDERPDPMAAELTLSPLPTPCDLPGPRVLGFLACGAVVRRDAFLEVGGFHPVVFFLGEETVLAQDLTAAGHGLCYVPDVVAHHHPGTAGDRTGRARLQLRNALLSSWLRRPLPGAAADTLAALRGARDPDVRGALRDAARRLPAVVAARRVLPPEVEADVRTLRRTARPSREYASPLPG